MGRYAIILILPFILGSCATSSYSPPQIDGNVGRLMRRPDAQAARKAAPEWCRDALKTINYLEGEIELRDSRLDDKK